MVANLIHGAAVWSLLALLLGACDTTEDGGVQVVRYQGPVITRESIQDSHLAWSASVDTVLRQVLIEGKDEHGEEHHRLLLADVDNDLPVYLGYSLRQANVALSIHTGTVQIQHFDLNGEVSGRIDGALPTGGRVGANFWLNLSRNIAEVR